ncbi:IMP cyclohydrolase /phosphoribosylaminoimidazolecarboxamide formyltransferase [Leifsonia sp. 98AMF]|uniref:bifunctional phosphoribosylaminoimidazolecarboxamide formyltransferase/IMP cyclohydrolase n=1 Tax=unclassified Leifsonia TaxID=2663824 RepID=UPI000879FB88|nr:MULTISPECIES: bifunctional phosphoribosylaminoimidazolecarboxamide formyltransferase/IMP cyclohydrolase [unclassified Leifsonia]SDH55743.1 IMP cyclohydrolase /phosphoribosylaminoimidazolecarboxamide formyltransferase [Leifsonia sp. 197AMF]SDI83108.1 IMP cyclohydrolase /phosphoribosylaminoimidazolecarboxamide formyltransferase [Leifsonia sp. 466MF]SDK00761.1 IMP cyclohydrolase /phosphoribosylaminoimidazolecarboxamide formyltransferase [Leifsonia sp. 157MF]SDN86273.1 IMP cyclohydrolase /phosph
MSGPRHDASLYRERDLVPIRRALISVSDKTGLLDLASALAAAGVEIVSTGSTAQTIRDAGHAVTDVASVTGFPESLDGRVKTLHPAIHSGLLADLRLASHEEQLKDLGIEPFELVVVNLYPFVETVASGAVGNDVVEQIDIGGPAMVRAAAKNHANVAIVVSPSDYDGIVEAVAAGGTTFDQRRELASKAFAHTAAYDGAVAAWFAGEAPSTDDFPERWEARAELKQTLRYGENSHQAAALYADPKGTGIAQATQLGGKEMSYNNYVDADAALRSAYDFREPAVAIIKHANPCGIAVADDIAEAHRKAHECDPVSAYGGVIAANRTVTLAMAETVKGIFTEVLIAPGYEPEALELLQTKKNLRILQLPEGYARALTEFRQISGGVLVQDSDRFDEFSSDGWTLVAGEEADAATRADLEFAWKACRAVKSNAILLAHDGASVGVGMGQVNRVDSCTLAVSRAGERSAGSVAASDAFFPFADGPQILIDAGVRAIVQPGGSIRDEDVIAAAKAAGVTMYFTGERHFFH